ncbi:MAG: LamG domain-containing protein [Rikenellaceae bacterium]
MKYFLLMAIATTMAISASAHDNDMVAYWSFDNDSENTVIDLSQNKNHGASLDVDYTKGVVGKAAYFNGKTSKIIIPNTPKEITNLKQGSISCWFKFENQGGQILPILYLGKATSGRPNHSMVIEVGHDRGNAQNRRLYLTTIVGRGSNFCVDSNYNLNENTWYHYVAVVSKSGNTIYINGKEHKNRRYNLGSNSSYTTFFYHVPTKELLSIGYGKYSQEEPFYSFKGSIDELRIYDSALSSEQVKALYSQGVK